MRLLVTKSVYDELMKSYRDKKIDYFKQEFIKILDKQEERDSEKVKKCLGQFEGYYSIGDEITIEKAEKWISTWHTKNGDVRMKKIASGKWVRIYDSETKGAKQAIRIIKNKIYNAKNVDELFNIVMEHTNRFRDENGKLLDTVYELQYEVNKKKGEFKIQQLNEKGINTFGFPYGKFSKDEYRVIANKADYASNRGMIDFNDTKKSAEEYLALCIEEWQVEPIESIIFSGNKVRIDGNGLKHFFQTGQDKIRNADEIEKRAKCLPYLRSILEKTGVKASCYQDVEGKISFTVMGKAKIDNVDTAIRVVVTRKKKGKLYYLSIHNLEEIKKDVAPTK